MKEMNKTTRGLSTLVAAMLLATVARAQDEREGWYGGLDLGMAVPRDMDTRPAHTGIPTNCDQHFSSVTVGDETLPLDLSDPRCARGQDKWENSFDLDNGSLLGLNVGYAWRGLRLEAEYFYRQHGGEYSAVGTLSGGKETEVVRFGERISDVSGHQFFGNGYYDFRDTGSKLIPYIGGGMGLMLARMDYSLEFHRNPDRDFIQSLGRHPDAAGTLTSTEDELSDTLWGYQLIVGADYPLTKRVFIGVKARYVDYLNDFEDGSSWDSLRGHASTIAPDGDEVRYIIRTDDLGFWGVSMNLKYFF